MPDLAATRTDQPANQPTKKSETAPVRPGKRPTSRAAVVRMYLLFGVLGICVFALWYDYKVARFGVDRAYNAIAELNDSKNSAAAHTMTTRKDVRRTLGREPSRIFQEGYATIEEYGWAAGFPLEFRGLYSENPEVALRTHNYYAVYYGTRLSTHYKYFLPLAEIREFQEVGDAPDSPPVESSAGSYYGLSEEYLRSMPGSTDVTEHLDAIRDSDGRQQGGPSGRAAGEAHDGEDELSVAAGEEASE